MSILLPPSWRTVISSQQGPVSTFPLLQPGDPPYCLEFRLPKGPQVPIPPLNTHFLEYLPKHMVIFYPQKKKKTKNPIGLYSKSLQSLVSSLEPQITVPLSTQNHKHCWAGHISLKLPKINTSPGCSQQSPNRMTFTRKHICTALVIIHGLCPRRSAGQVSLCTGLFRWFSEAITW